MRWTLAAYALLGGFFVVERALRQGDAAVSMDAGPDDRGTSRLITVGFQFLLGSALLAPILSRSGWGRTTGSRLGIVGVGMMAAGLGLKAWAMRTLGRFYTRTLRTEAQQSVVQEGPYRLVRHPGYLATLLVWVGFGWASRNWLVGALTTLALLVVYGRRIQVEEAMLLEALGESYADYCRRTWRLLPGLV